MSPLKKIINLFWFDGENKKFSLQNDEEYSFNLEYGNLLVGALSFYDNKWHFSYAPEFIAQNEILPLINFATLDKEYVSKQLWPFFASRIPSSAQRQDKSVQEDNLIPLLKQYGRAVVSNPFILSPI